MSRLEQIAKQIEQNALPPVHLWTPDLVGEIDIHIDAQGFWFHEGESISRESLVRLFSSILWCENGRHFLITPVEKLEIRVDDAAYVVHQMESANEAWIATTNTHEQVIIGKNHPVELRQYKQQWVPYVNIRYDLWARVNRSIYYQWVEAAMERDEHALALISNGYEFIVAKA